MEPDEASAALDAGRLPSRPTVVRPCPNYFFALFLLPFLLFFSFFFGPVSGQWLPSAAGKPRSTGEAESTTRVAAAPGLFFFFSFPPPSLLLSCFFFPSRFSWSFPPPSFFFSGAAFCSRMTICILSPPPPPFFFCLIFLFLPFYAAQGLCALHRRTIRPGPGGRKSAGGPWGGWALAQAARGTLGTERGRPEGPAVALSEHARVRDVARW